MLTQEKKEHCVHVCQGLFNQFEAEGDSFLDHIIASDETWCHHCELESKQHIYHIVQIWHLLISICSGQWKMDCVGNIFLAIILSEQL